MRLRGKPINNESKQGLLKEHLETYKEESTVVNYEGFLLEAYGA
jgi:hypothetical protein